MIVEMKKTFLGLRAGEVSDVDAGLADLLIQRGFAAKYDPPPKGPIKKKSPRRAVKGPEETRVQFDADRCSDIPAGESR